MFPGCTTLHLIIRTESPRVRLYIALNEHISADEYRKYTKVLESKIGHPVDEGKLST